jgi:hypothetical protein
MVQRAAGAAAGEDAPATRARRRTARPAVSEAEDPRLRAQPRVTARRVRLSRGRPPSAASSPSPNAVSSTRTKRLRDAPGPTMVEVSGDVTACPDFAVSGASFLHAATSAGCWSSIEPAVCGSLPNRRPAASSRPPLGPHAVASLIQPWRRVCLGRSHVVR